MSWTHELDRVLPLLGHRNWILVVDKAYPLQSSPGITTIDTQASLTAVLEKVVASVKTSTHVNPIFYTDKELGFISEDLAPGVEAFARISPAFWLARVLRRCCTIPSSRNWLKPQNSSTW